MSEKPNNLASLPFSRRGFLAGAGAVTAATITGCGDSTAPYTPATSTTGTPGTAVTPTDIDILNFALNLEYLEAEFYLRAISNAGIPTADQGSGAGAVTVKASSKVNFSNSFLQQLAFELAQTELQHVRAIKATITSLGGTPVAAPALNFTDAFNTIGSLAGFSGGFDPFATDYNFLIAALTFEEIGVSAYTGAARLITATAVLDAAAGIQAAEAYHSGCIRTLLVGNAFASASTARIDAYNSILQVLNKLDTAGNTTLLVQGAAAATQMSTTTVNIPTASTVVSANANALAFARTTDQVLHLAYGTTPGTYTTGGFFPSGLNGTIKTPTT